MKTCAMILYSTRKPCGKPAEFRDYGKRNCNFWCAEHEKLVREFNGRTVKIKSETRRNKTPT